MGELNRFLEDVSGNTPIHNLAGPTMDDICERYIPDYDRSRFDALAFRVYIGDDTLLTVFAIEKGKLNENKDDQDRTSLKKFRINSIPASELSQYCASFNYMLSTSNYP